MSEQDHQDPLQDLPVVFSYTRAQAIADGVLVDLTTWASETGFRYPVACTAAVRDDYIVPAPVLCQAGQSERGRAHDLLYMLWTAIRGGGDGQALIFETLFLQQPRRHVMATFKALCGPGDDGQPVVTIMLEHED